MKRGVSPGGATPDPPAPRRSRVDDGTAAAVEAEYSALTEGLYDFAVLVERETGQKGVFARQEVREGAVLCVEPPFVCWPLKDAASPSPCARCENCLKTLPSAVEVCCSPACAASFARVSQAVFGVGGPLSQCASCMQAVRATAWDASGSMALVPEAVVRVLGSVAVRFSRIRDAAGPGASVETMQAEAGRQLERLVAPRAETGFYAANKEYIKALTAVVGDACRPHLAAAVGEEFSTQLLQEGSVGQIFGQLALNAQRIGCKMAVGAGLYVLQSCLNHSCAPNCGIRFDEPDDPATIALVARRDIEAGEELTLAYVDVSGLTRSERRANLMHAFCFACECHLCVMEGEIENRLRLASENLPV